MIPFYVIIISALAALIATVRFQPHILRIAKDKDIVDNPDARKLQRIPVPVMGGVAVVFGLCVGVMILNMFGHFYNLFAVFTAVVIVMFVGFVDDVKGLSPKVRFLVEVLLIISLIFATGNQISNFHGLWGVEILSPLCSVPLTVFACVGILNAINLIDGVDGYSSGYCIMASALFGYVFYQLGSMRMVALAAIMIAALLPFFLCNVFGRHSKMFIGDAGTLSMGVLMSTFVCNMLASSTDISTISTNIGLIPLSLSIMSVPIFDTLRVMSSRICRGTSPFHPDKTHLHHLFIDYGFSHIGTTFSILCMNCLVVATWFLSYKLGASIDEQLYVVIAMSVLITFVFYSVMNKLLEKGGRVCEAMKALGRITHVERKGIWLTIQKWLDRNVAPKEEN